MYVLLLSLQRDLDIMGLKVLHHVLLEHGHQSRLLYLPEYDDKESSYPEMLRRFVAEDPPGLIGISLMTGDFLYARAVTVRLKDWFPEIPVVWGGVHPTIQPEECVVFADYLCIGEGEQTLTDMADALDAGRPLDGIKNLCFRRQGILYRNPLYPLIEDLDSLPVSRQIPPNSFVQVSRGIQPLNTAHLQHFKRYRGCIYKIMATRGCPYGCTYCVNHFMRKLYARWPIRRRSIAHLLEELEAAICEGPPVVYVDLADDVFLTADLPYLQEFCTEYRRRIGRPFIAKTTPRYLSREKLDLLMEAGLGWMNMGLQSANRRVCEEVYKRAVSKEAFLEAARLINEYPVAVYYDIITDNPFETVEETLETAEILTETPRPYYPLLFSMTLYPGTELRDRALTVCPDRCDEGLTKDYLKLDYRPVNNLLELAAFLHRPLMHWLIARFRRAPESLITQAAVSLAKAYCQFCLGPLAYIRLIRRSQRGSWLGTFRALPVYLDRGLLYYFRRFKWFKRRKDPTAKNSN